jgi:hypothetical protein
MIVPSRLVPFHRVGSVGNSAASDPGGFRWSGCSRLPLPRFSCVSWIAGPRRISDRSSPVFRGLSIGVEIDEESQNYHQLCRAISYAGFGKLRFKLARE